MAFYLANDGDLASVANALRAKTGLSKQLVFPDEFVSTINSITGDGIEISIDSTPTENSNNAVSSGGVYSALAAKQDTLTFDSTPTRNSSNPVTSGGIYTALQSKMNNLAILDSIDANSSNPIKSSAIYRALQTKQNNLTQVPITEFIYSTDYLFVERNGTIYKVLVSALLNDSPESDPDALSTDDGGSILTESEDELVIDRMLM